jgi:hypothetical protein
VVPARKITKTADIIFIIFIYQRWIYKVDPTRPNEFGQVAVPPPSSDDSAAASAGLLGASETATEGAMVANEPTESVRGPEATSEETTANEAGGDGAAAKGAPDEKTDVGKEGNVGSSGATKE